MKLFFIISYLFILNLYPFYKLKANLISNKKLFDTFIDLNYKSGEFLRLFIADDPIEKESGLMGIKKLDPNYGMIFVFDPPEKIKFWMKNTLIPLDIIFIKNDNIIEILQNVLPCTLDECPLFGPKEKVDFVIEVKSGRSKELGFEVGNKIYLKKKF